MGQFSSDQVRDSLASLEATWVGVTLRGIQKLTFSDEVAIDPIYGNGSVSVGGPAGQHKASGSLQTITSELQNLMAGLGDQWSQVPGTIQLSLNEQNGDGFKSYTLTTVRITKVDLDFGEAGGNKGSMGTLDFIIFDPVDFDGLSSIRDQRATAGLLFAF